MKRCIALLFFCLVLTLTGEAYTLKDHLDSQIDPRIETQTIETEFFSIHFHRNYLDLALYMASVVDGIHDKVTSELNIDWREKTHIVIAHRSDTPAIFTQAFPHNQIFLEPTLPSQDMGLNNYDVWYQWVLIHEYTHVLHLNRQTSAHGNLLRSLFGSFYKPNQLLPAWLKEGQAVKIETLLSRTGRAQSSVYRMMLRAAFDENKLSDPHYVNLQSLKNFEDTHWPWTLRPYLFGSEMTKEIASLDEPIDDEARILQQALDRISSRASSEIAELKKHPLTSLEFITNTGYYYHSPVVSADGKILTVTHDEPNQPPRILSFYKNEDHWIATASADKNIERYTGYQSEISKNSKYLVFDYTEPNNQFYLESEIAIMNREDQSILRSTPHLRARDATIHPNGEILAFIINEAGKNVLVRANTDWQNIERLTPDLGFARLSAPRFSPSGDKIVFTMHNDLTGGEDVCVWVNNKINVIISDGYLNLHPTWVSDDVVLFSSDKTGAFNIYQVDLNKKTVHQISHVLGGLFYPWLDLNTQWIYAIGFRAQGYDLVRFKADQDLLKESIKVSLLNPEKLPTDLVKNSNDRAFEISSYEPRKYLKPQYLFPTMSFQPGLTQAGFEIGAVDPLYYKSYFLRLNYDDSSKKISSQWFYYTAIDRNSVDLAVTSNQYSKNKKNDLSQSTQINGHFNFPLDSTANHFHLRPGLKYLNRDGEKFQEWAGGELSLRWDSEYKPSGYHVSESGKYFESNLSYLPAKKDYTDVASFDFKYRDHIKLNHDRILHFQSIGIANINSNSDFLHYAGGRLSFPYTLDSNLTLYGYPINAIASEKIMVNDLYVTNELKFLGRSYFSDSIYLTHSYWGFRTQVSVAESLTPNPVVWSLGLELNQDFVLENIFDFSFKIGLFQGEKSKGGETQLYISMSGSE